MKIKKFGGIFTLCIAVLGILSPAAIAASFDSRIDTVTAVVTADSNLPPLVKSRMEESVAAIGSQLLTGQKIAEVQEKRQAQEKIISEVFDKVLVGYTVTKVIVEPQENAVVTVELLPWSDTIKTVTVDTTIEGMSPRIEKLAQQDLLGADEVFKEALTGLPLAATDWTNGVLKHRLNSFLAEHLPEFRADFELEPAANTKVTLTVYPKLPVVRTVDLSMRSDTVPNFSLLNHRSFMQDNVNDLVGVPVAFVARHKEELAAEFARALDAMPDFKAISLKTTVNYEAAERLKLMSRSDTAKFRFRLTGWQDIGRDERNHHRKDDNLNFRFHAGVMLNNEEELLALIDIMPLAADWNWQLGYKRQLNSFLSGNVRYDMRKKRFILGTAARLLPKWQLRYEYRWADSVGETALGYKLHDFLALEYAIDNHQRWLRLIGNF